MRFFSLFLPMVFFLNTELLSQFGKKEKDIQSKINTFSLSSFSQAIHRDSVRIVTFLEIPYSVLQFVKTDSLYKAFYQASLSMKSLEGLQLDQFSWRDSIFVYDYFDTKSLTLNRKHFSIFQVSKFEEIKVVGELQDLDTRKKGLKENTISHEKDDNTLNLFTPIFLLNLNGDWGFSSGKIPTYGQTVREIGEGVDLNVSGYVNSNNFEILVSLSNNTLNDSVIIKKKFENDKGFFNEYFFIKSQLLNSLKNDFRITLKQGEISEQKDISFSKFKSGISSYVNNIDLAIKQMKYIINEREIDKNHKKVNKDKENYFYNLWKAMDPTPKTEFNELMDEYYRRVSYANENFEGWKEGWETDRGMIYILFGPPDQVERTNPSIANSTLYQIWTYNKIQKQFIFKDQNGFGDFRLDSPFNGLGVR